MCNYLVRHYSSKKKKLFGETYINKLLVLNLLFDALMKIRQFKFMIIQKYNWSFATVICKINKEKSSMYAVLEILKKGKRVPSVVRISDLLKTLDRRPPEQIQSQHFCWDKGTKHCFFLKSTIKTVSNYSKGLKTKSPQIKCYGHKSKCSECSWTTSNINLAVINSNY